MKKSYYNFPENFIWGAATAAFQVEGFPYADGAGASTWSNFCDLPGRIANDDNADIGSGQYRRYQEDVQLMKWLGLDAYRFSLSWSRILPDGTGHINQRGLDYYARLIDSLLKAGIEPWITLFHWDTPLALEERYGGWRSMHTVKAFADYAALVAEKFSDRVKHFFTINEVSNFTEFAYNSPYMAPGLELGAQTAAQTVHHGLLAHGMAVRAIRENAKRKVRVGLAENMLVPVPYLSEPVHIEAAKKAMRRENASKLTALLEGEYPVEWLREMASDAPVFTSGEMAIINTPIDFIGANIYFPTYVRAADTPDGYATIPLPESYPTLDMPWLAVGPEITYWTPRLLKEIWNVDNVYISENGCAVKDQMDREGGIYDTDRIMYLKNHFISASRAVNEGWPLKGYFVWSLLDNFEWNSGFSKRFGIVYVNYQTLERTPKASAEFYRRVIAANGIN